MTHFILANGKLMEFVVAGDRIMYSIFFWIKIPVKVEINKNKYGLF